MKNIFIYNKYVILNYTNFIIMSEFWNYIKNNPMWMIGAIFAIGGLLATLYASYTSGRQTDNIENLAKQNVELGKKIKDLNEATSLLVSNIDTITTKSSDLIVENVRLTEKSNSIIEEVSSLTRQTKVLISLVNERTERAAAENLKTGELLFSPSPLSETFQVSVGTTTGIKSIRDIKNGLSGDFYQFDSNVFSVKFDENNRPLFNLQVKGENGELIMEMVDNKWRPNNNTVGKYNYDDTAFEVIDNYGRVAINLQIVGSNHIYINGIFFGNQGMVTYAGPKGMTINPSDGSSTIIRLEIFPIFEYTGKNWLHKRKRGN